MQSQHSPMAGSENPFSLFFSSEDEIKTARETSERQNQELSNTLTRIFLVVGKGKYIYILYIYIYIYI